MVLVSLDCVYDYLVSVSRGYCIIVEGIVLMIFIKVEDLLVIYLFYWIECNFNMF